MERRAFLMRLKPGQAGEYRRRHEAIWPELKALLTEEGIVDYSIFLDERTHTLFATHKVRPGADLSDLPTRPIMRKWWDYMADIMETQSDNAPVQEPLREVFHMD